MRCCETTDSKQAYSDWDGPQSRWYRNRTLWDGHYSSSCFSNNSVVAVITVITVTAAPLQIAQHLLCAGHCPESPVNINSLNSHNNSTRQVLLSPFYGWGSWASQILNDLPKDAWLVSGGLRFDPEDLAPECVAHNDDTEQPLPWEIPQGTGQPGHWEQWRSMSYKWRCYSDASLTIRVDTRNVQHPLALTSGASTRREDGTGEEAKHGPLLYLREMVTCVVGYENGSSGQSTRTMTDTPHRRCQTGIPRRGCWEPATWFSNAASASRFYIAGNQGGAFIQRKLLVSCELDSEGWEMSAPPLVRGKGTSAGPPGDLS